MLLTALFPFACGIAMIFARIRSSKGRLIFAETATIITSLLCVRLLMIDPQEVKLLSFGHGLYLSFCLDGAGRIFLALISFLWPLAILFSNEYMEHEERDGTFTGFYLMTYGVMVIMCCAHTLFTMYLAYEILTLVTLPLVWHKKDRDSIHAARVYVCYSIGAAAMGFVAMVAVCYYGGGAFVINNHMLEPMPGSLMRLAFVLSFFGFGVKAAVFPLSSWLPRACAAPTPVTALLHAVAVVNAGVFAVMRMTYYIFDPHMLIGTWAQTVVEIGAILTILYGAVMAVRVRHVKRKLAFSTISNLGYMLFGISLLTTSGMQGALMHMVCHSLIKITLFFCIGAIMCKTERTYMSEMFGMAKVMPKVFGVFVLGSIALMGIPPFCGFGSKYYLITAAVESGDIMAVAGAISLLISAVLTAVYTLSVLIPAYSLPLENAEELPARKCEPSWRMLVPMVLLCVMIIVVGVYSQSLHSIISTAVNAVKGGM